MTPTDLGMARTRTTTPSPAMSAAYPAGDRGDVVLFPDRWAAECSPLTNLSPLTVTASPLAVTRTAPNDAGSRPESGSGSLRPFPGRRSTVHTTDAPAALVFAKRAHIDELPSVETGGGAFRAGRVTTGPTPKLRLIRPVVNIRQYRTRTMLNTVHHLERVILDFEAHREARCPKVIQFPTSHRGEVS